MAKMMLFPVFAKFKVNYAHFYLEWLFNGIYCDVQFCGLLTFLSFTLAVITGCSLKASELQRTGRFAHMGCHGNHLPLCCAAAEHNFPLKGCSLHRCINSNMSPVLFVPVLYPISFKHHQLSFVQSRSKSSLINGSFIRLNEKVDGPITGLSSAE